MRDAKIETDPIILMYALRYALGRRSYAVGDVVRALRTHRDQLPSGMRRLIVDEIGTAIARQTAGDPVQVEQWLLVARAMEAA